MIKRKLHFLFQSTCSLYFALYLIRLQMIQLHQQGEFLGKTLRYHSFVTRTFYLSAAKDVLKLRTFVMRLSLCISFGTIG